MVKLAAITALGLISLTGQTAAATVKILPFGASIVGAPVCCLRLCIIAPTSSFQFRALIN